MAISKALGEWRTTRQGHLDELEQAHVAVGGNLPGRRWLTGQVNAAYIIAIAAQFQGFCRDLHTEGSFAVAGMVPTHLEALVASALTSTRNLDRGNALPGKIAEDFRRLSIDLWPAVYARHPSWQSRRDRLEVLMIWRNALAHDAPISTGNQQKIAGTRPTKAYARQWRNNVNLLATAFDAVVARELRGTLGQRPWS